MTRKSFHRSGCETSGRARAARRSSSGFTLIELLISASLTAIILVAAYVCLSACLASQKLMEARLEVVQNARVAMAILSADLRCACPLSKDYDFLGVRRRLGEIEADSIDFATHNYTPRRPYEGDFCQQSVFVDADRETGELCLWRRRNPTIAFDPLSGGSREEIARGVRGLRFEYYDGLDWYADWGEQNPRKQETSWRYRGNLSGLPEAVRITLWLDPDPKAKPSAWTRQEDAEPPMVFQTVARLNLAGATSSATGGGSQAESPTSTSGAPGAPEGRR